MIKEIRSGYCIEELGSEATREDLDKWVAYLEHRLQEQYPDTTVHVVASDTCGFMTAVTMSDGEVYDYKNASYRDTPLDDVEDFINTVFENELAKALEVPPMKFRHYTYGNNPGTLPLDCDGYIEGYDEICTAAGFNPEDEEVNVCTLTEDWNNHPAGSIVVTGLTTAGHPFAVAE